MSYFVALMVYTKNKKEIYMEQNIILIAVGNAGCKILSKAKIKLSKLYLDTDPEDIKKYSDDRNNNENNKVFPVKNINAIRIGKKICGKFSALGNMILGIYTS